MLKKTITYEDFDGNNRNDVFYFNLTKTELTEMESSVEGGMKNLLEKMVETEDVKEMLVFFKQIIMKSVGIKSDDGRRFMKSDEIANDFVSSAAFDSLFMELAHDANKAADFVNGILPKDLSESVDEKLKKTANTYLEANGLPTPPSPQND